jgi:hypothetical protein
MLLSLPKQCMRAVATAQFMMSQLEDDEGLPRLQYDLPASTDAIVPAADGSDTACGAATVCPRRTAHEGSAASTSTQIAASAIEVAGTLSCSKGAGNRSVGPSRGREHTNAPMDENRVADGTSQAGVALSTKKTSAEGRPRSHATFSSVYEAAVSFHATVHAASRAECLGAECLEGGGEEPCSLPDEGRGDRVWEGERCLPVALTPELARRGGLLANAGKVCGHASDLTLAASTPGTVHPSPSPEVLPWVCRPGGCDVAAADCTADTASPSCPTHHQQPACISMLASPRLGAPVDSDHGMSGAPQQRTCANCCQAPWTPAARLMATGACAAPPFTAQSTPAPVPALAGTGASASPAGSTLFPVSCSQVIAETPSSVFPQEATPFEVAANLDSSPRGDAPLASPSLPAGPTDEPTVAACVLPAAPSNVASKQPATAHTNADRAVMEGANRGARELQPPLPTSSSELDDLLANMSPPVWAPAAAAGLLTQSQAPLNTLPLQAQCAPHSKPSSAIEHAGLQLARHSMSAPSHAASTCALPYPTPGPHMPQSVPAGQKWSVLQHGQPLNGQLALQTAYTFRPQRHSQERQLHPQLHSQGHVACQQLHVPLQHQHAHLAPEHSNRQQWPTQQGHEVIRCVTSNAQQQHSACTAQWPSQADSNLLSGPRTSRSAPMQPRHAQQACSMQSQHHEPQQLLHNPQQHPAVQGGAMPPGNAVAIGEVCVPRDRLTDGEAVVVDRIFGWGRVPPARSLQSQRDNFLHTVLEVCLCLCQRSCVASASGA